VPNLGDPYTPAESRVSRVFDRLNSRIGAIIMTAADDAVQAATAQLVKAKGEIDAEVAKLQEAGVSPESLAGLQAISQSLDDLNADAPVEEPPTEEPPVEEPPVDEEPTPE
jgi:hypothetical protein